MQRFVILLEALDRSTKTSEKLRALEAYFQEVPAADAAWALYILSGKKLPPPVKRSQLRHWISEVAKQPAWMVDACYEVVGDLAETLTLLLPPGRADDAIPPPSLSHCIEHLLSLGPRDSETKHAAVTGFWLNHGPQECFVFNKLLTGGLRVGVSRSLVERAVAASLQVEHAFLAHRLTGDWQPSTDFWQSLRTTNDTGAASRPYPFYLASPIEENSPSSIGQPETHILDRLQQLGPPEDWAIEWKWDGVRAQLIHREGTALLWSRGEEIINSAFPEILDAAHCLPLGTVLDGELLVWKNSGPGTFQQLQKRLGRLAPSPALLQSHPCIFIVYDLLEFHGLDCRSKPWEERRQQLVRLCAEPATVRQSEPCAHPHRDTPGTQLELFADPAQLAHSPNPSAITHPPAPSAIQLTPTIPHPALQLSPVVPVKDWTEAQRLQQTSRQKRVEGFILKRRNSTYLSGRVRGDWWKWKVAPYTIDCVLLNAQAGHGRRAGLYTDFTFGVHHQGQIIPVTKAYSGLTDAEFRTVDRWIKDHTLGRRGPIRLVQAQLVFEIAFEGLQASPRHRSGIALRFPRIARLRPDKIVEQANSLDDLKALLAQETKKNQTTDEN